MQQEQNDLYYILKPITGCFMLEDTGVKTFVQTKSQIIKLIQTHIIFVKINKT